MKRNNRIDIIKAIGILLMVLGHARFPFSHFIYLFHMPIFFIAAGYCYNNKYSTNGATLLELLKKRLLSLWLPYVLYNLGFLVLHNFFVQINIMTNSSAYLDSMGVYNLSGGYAQFYNLKDGIIAAFKILLFSAPEPMAGAAWFLRVLLVITFLYTLTEYLIDKFFPQRRNLLQFLLAVIAIGISFGISFTGFAYMNIPTMFSGYMLFYIGILLRKYNFEKHITASTKILAGAGCASFVLLIILNSYGSVNIDLNQYTNPLFLLCASLAGWVLVWSVATIIDRFRWSRIFFCYLGQNTIPVLLLHFLCFKIITYLEVKAFDLEDYMLAAFPVLIHDGFWWVLYGIAGVGIPLLLTWAWQKYFRSHYAKK